LACAKSIQALALDPENAEAASLKIAIDTSSRDAEKQRGFKPHQHARRLVREGNISALRFLRTFSLVTPVSASWPSCVTSARDRGNGNGGEERFEEEPRRRRVAGGACAALRTTSSTQNSSSVAMSEIDASTPELRAT